MNHGPWITPPGRLRSWPFVLNLFSFTCEHMVLMDFHEDSMVEETKNIIVPKANSRNTLQSGETIKDEPQPLHSLYTTS